MTLPRSLPELLRESLAVDVVPCPPGAPTVPAAWPWWQLLSVPSDFTDDHFSVKGLTITACLILWCKEMHSPVLLNALVQLGRESRGDSCAVPNLIYWCRAPGWCCCFFQLMDLFPLIPLCWMWWLCGCRACSTGTELLENVLFLMSCFLSRAGRWCGSAWGCTIPVSHGCVCGWRWRICSMGSSLRWHSHGDVEPYSQGGTQGCFPSSSAVLLQDSASVEETWVGFLWFSVLCFFNKWFIALQHTRGSEGTVPLEQAGLCAAAGCSLMDPSYAAGTAAWAGKQLLWFYSVNPSM